MRKKEKAIKIRDLDIDEISLVDRAANRRRFAITKKEKNEMFTKLIELLKNWMKPEDITDEVQTAIKAIPEDELKKHVAALEILQEYNDPEVMPADFKGVLTGMVKAVYLPAADKKEDKDPEITLDMFIEKAGAVFSAATKSQIEKVIAMLQGLVGKDKDDKKKSDDSLTDEQRAKLARADEILKAEEDRKSKEKTAVEKAREDRIVGMEKTIAELKKTRGTSSQLDEGDEDDEGKKKDTKKAVEDKFPSMQIFAK